jgi:hypothetical protein
MGSRHLVGAAVLVLAGAASGNPPEQRSTLADQQAVAVTVYNGDLALVKDRRGVDLPAGPVRLALREVSAQIRPETALLRRVDGGAIAVLEQNFEFDLLSPARLLEKYVGRSVRLARVNPATGAETLETAEVLAAGEGVVLRAGERIETEFPGRIVFEGVPDDLRDRPTLVVDLEAAGAGRRTLELGYLTGGLSWQADYVAELAPDATRLDLAGWVTLANRSGSSYRDARLQLVAGDVHRVEDAFARARGAEVMAMQAPAPKIREEGLLDYHLYTLERPTTLADRQTKQVALLTAAGVPAGREYRVEGQPWYYQGAQPEGVQVPVAVWLGFQNRAPALGRPLPAGVVRVYTRDRDGGMQFVGEDRMGHTPRDQPVNLRLGTAFDLTARRVQTDYREGTGWGGRARGYETAHRITLSNGGEAARTVDVLEPVPGEWKILAENARHEKLGAHLVRWRIEVPARGERVLEYRAAVALP